MVGFSDFMQSIFRAARGNFRIFSAKMAKKGQKIGPKVPKYFLIFSKFSIWDPPTYGHGVRTESTAPLLRAVK